METEEALVVARDCGGGGRRNELRVTIKGLYKESL
jgi:hypothetical protein